MRTPRATQTKTCARCGRPIGAGEPAAHIASVDIVGDRAVATAARSYHIPGGCWDAARREAWEAGSPSAA